MQVIEQNTYLQQFRTKPPKKLHGYVFFWKNAAIFSKMVIVQNLGKRHCFKEIQKQKKNLKYLGSYTTDLRSCPHPGWGSIPIYRWGRLTPQSLTYHVIWTNLMDKYH